MKDRAGNTRPQGVFISISRIRQAGLGAYTLQNFPKNTLFGPYEGEEVGLDNYRKIAKLTDGGYAWEVS